MIFLKALYMEDLFLERLYCVYSGGGTADSCDPWILVGNRGGVESRGDLVEGTLNVL
jgi:hypothetical protein